MFKQFHEVWFVIYSYVFLSWQNSLAFVTHVKLCSSNILLIPHNQTDSNACRLSGLRTEVAVLLFRFSVHSSTLHWKNDGIGTEASNWGAVDGPTWSGSGCFSEGQTGQLVTPSDLGRQVRSDESRTTSG